MSENRDMISRRKMFKIASGIGISSLIISPNSAKGEERANCNQEVRPEIIERTAYGLGSGYGWEQEGKAALLHNSSGYTQEGNWIHDIGISGAAAGEGWNGSALHGHKYKVQGPQGELAALTGNNQHGVHPQHTNEDIADWANTFLELTVGTLNVGAGWFLSVGQQLIDSMSPGQGFNFQVPNGIGYTNVDGVGDPIGHEVSHFHRFFYKSQYHAPQIKVQTSVSPTGDPVYRVWENVEIETLLNTSYSLNEDSPRKMSDQRKRDLGIRRAPKQLDIHFDGERKNITHIMTRNPFTARVTHSTTHERR